MRRALLWLVMCASAVLLCWAGQRYYAARSDSRVALRQLDLVRADAEAIADLRAAAPPESRRHRPPPGLATRLGDVISKAGLPPSSLQNLTPETESAYGSAGLKRQVAKLTLDGLTLPELGCFLQEWRTAQPLWTVSSIDITPASARMLATPGHATDRPLRATITIETIFADDQAKEGSR
jgi:hypothetical protein